jgi:hypothetical protein
MRFTTTIMYATALPPPPSGPSLPLATSGQCVYGRRDGRGSISDLHWASVRTRPVVTFNMIISESSVVPLTSVKLKQVLDQYLKFKIHSGPLSAVSATSACHQIVRKFPSA